MSENILNKSQYGKLIFENDKQFYENVYANIQLSISFVSKAMGTNRVNDYKYVKLPIKDSVLKMIISSDVYSFGHKCSLMLVSVDDNIIRILENGDMIHCVVNIAVGDKAEDTDSNEEKSTYTQLEPYIFEVLDVKTVTSGNKKDTIILSMCDIFASTAKKHSWASVVKFNPGISTATSYSSIITLVFDYLKQVISFETNKAYTIEKDLYYESDELASEKLIAMTLKRIKSGASIYEALEEIWKDLSVSFEYPDSFKSAFETFSSGKPLIPAILQDEYLDAKGLYINGLNKYSGIESTSSVGEEVEQKRYMCLRSILSPFIIGFTGGSGATTRGAVWDVVNPPSSSLNNDPTLLPMGTATYTYSAIENFIKYPISPKITFKGWKNYVFQTETVGGESGGKGQFIFYNWVHALFNYTFFNAKSVDTQEDEFASYILPGFAVLETDADRSAGDPGNTLNFNEANCVVKPIKTDEFEQEVLLNVGKELSSLLLWANEYSFRIKGSFKRRPNELMKIYTNVSTDDVNEIANSQVITDNFGNPFIILYLTSVDHVFDIQANSYYNNCYGVRPCTYISK